MSTLDMFKYEKNVTLYPAGTTVFRLGDTPDLMYVIQDGTAEVWVEDRLIEQLEPGAIFGEMALVDTSPRSATVIAKTDMKLVPIDEAAFRRHVHSTPFFALQVMRILVARLRRLMHGGIEA